LFKQPDYILLASVDSEFGIDRSCFRDRAIHFSGSSDSIHNDSCYFFRRLPWIFFEIIV